jgi:hypothetical protein
MKSTLLVFFLLIGALTVPSRASALDPSTFLKVLDIDIKKLKTSTGDFMQAKKKLGPTKQIDTGDAASYEGRVEYIPRSRPEMLTLFITECTEGYRVRWLNPSERPGKTIMKPNVQKIEVDGLYLGMNKDEIENIFMGTPSGGWSIEEAKKTYDSQKVIYKKTIEVISYQDEKNYFTAKKNYFCDRIWISMKFDRLSKLSEYNIETGGCDDQACEAD